MAAYTSTIRNGPPESGTYLANDTVTDPTGTVWTCYEGGNPGKFVLTPTIAGSITAPTVAGPIATTSGAGTLNGATVSVAEYGDGTTHKTVLTLTATPITLTDDPNNGQYGGVKIYTFPAGNVIIQGAVVSTTLTLLTPFIDTATGNLGLGTVAPTVGTTLTTTRQNIIASTAISALVAKVGPARAPSVASVTLDGTGTPVPVYLNIRIDDDAAHITKAGNLITGTVTLLWTNAGGY